MPESIYDRIKREAAEREAAHAEGLTDKEVREKAEREAKAVAVESWAKVRSNFKEAIGLANEQMKDIKLSLGDVDGSEGYGAYSLTGAAIRFNEGASVRDPSMTLMLVPHETAVDIVFGNDDRGDEFHSHEDMEKLTVAEADRLVAMLVEKAYG